jgi:hypothetical protein
MNGESGDYHPCIRLLQHSSEGKQKSLPSLRLGRLYAQYKLVVGAIGLEPLLQGISVGISRVARERAPPLSDTDPHQVP